MLVRCWSQRGHSPKQANAVADVREERSLRVVIAAGGTGGHVYPAIAIADEIRRRCHAVEVEFVGSKDRMEWVAVPKAGYKITAIPAVPIRRPFASLENLLLPAKLIVALFFSWKMLCQVRPHVVVGTGGYVSGPPCLVAAMMKCPVVIQEQNAFAGLSNRLLGSVAEAVLVAFSAAIPCFPRNKCVLCGNPTRKELRQNIAAEAARTFFFPQARAEISFHNQQVAGAQEFSSMHFEVAKNQLVLVLGGSLGAKTINRAVADMAITMLEENPSRYIIWQTGPTYYEEVIAQVGTHPRLAVFPYVHTMQMAYAAADLVVARAGAITCSELLVTGKPSILIPSANVAEDHQTKNAMEMAKEGTAEVLLEGSLCSSALSDLINDLLADTSRLGDMKAKALKASTPDASSWIAEYVLDIAERCHSLTLA